MKSLMLFLQEILDDLGNLCGTSTRLDLKEIELRVKHEGISFLTISLPTFGKSLEKGLDRGYVAHDLFTGFRWTSGLPRLFGGFLELVFDRKTGRLLRDPSIPAIFAIRQICLMFAKIGLDCAEWRIRDAIDGYMQCEKDVRAADASLSPRDLDCFKRIGRLLWSDTFQAVDEDIFYGRIVPKHGPGATAEKLSSNAKWIMTEWTQRLDRYFPHWEYLTTSVSRSNEWLTTVQILEPGQERPVRVVTVPKTLKSPRIIAIEPACMMFIQQGILGSFERELFRNNFPGKFIRWDDQTPNQRMALDGSENGNLATLDLSEASDRVSNQHVRALLENFPNLAGGVDSCRSRKADVPGHGVIRLAKFASMGSALTFPFESIVFLTIIFLGIERELNRPLTRRDIESFAGSVRVYGDDIIVPTDYVHSVVSMLETFGFRVNRDKSFWNGKFRESCGKEYYDGHDVSITRMRSLLPTSRKDASGIVSTVSMRNQLYKAGLWRAARFLDTYLEELIPLPVVSEKSPVLGRHSFLTETLWGVPVRRLHPHYQVPVVRGLKVTGRAPEDILDGPGALLKCLTLLTLREGDGLPSISVDHLERSGRPKSIRTKLGWGPAH